MLSLSCLLPVAFLTFTTIATAQQDAPPVAVEVQAVKKETAAVQKKEKEEKEAPKESPRMQKLKQLSFDRRPSAILKAWAPALPDEPKEKAPADPKAAKAKPDPLDAEMKALQRNVTLGNWAALKAYLAGLPADEAKAGYEHLLQALQGTPTDIGPRMRPGMPPMAMQYGERNRFTPDDIVGLAAAAPKGLTKEIVSSLGSLISQVIDGGIVVEGILARFKAEIGKPSAAVLTRRQAAQLLSAAGQNAVLGHFLPSFEVARGDQDVEALNLLARHFMGLSDTDKKLVYLEKAWAATQSVLAMPGPRTEHEAALHRAVELAPRLKAELGQAWLDKSFTEQPERGMTILATLGALSAQGLQSHPHDIDGRLKTLELQKTAVVALLKAAPDRARAWQATVDLIAGNWLKEAQFTHQFAPGSGAARMRRDRWGNIYFFDDDQQMMQMRMAQNPNQPRPVAILDMLKAGPEGLWLERVSAPVRPKLHAVLCQLHLKVDEEVKAFPHIEGLAATHPQLARSLANEFLDVWTRNHDPNAARSYTSSYMFMYGFDVRANGIPLTRSKQERNLDDLAGWVGRLRKLPIGDPDEERLAKAFTTCHSTAEVYRKEAIEKVFGKLSSLKPKTLAGLAQQMRENLAGVWRKPEEQKDKKTNRKTKDIQVEVLRGYAVARGVVDQALQKSPGDWSLLLARAALMHDEVGFRQELGKSTEFAPKRNEAYAEFERAARLYATAVKDLAEEDQSTKVFEQWFYAGLGACDLGQVTEEKLPDLRQPPKIRAAILALPGETAEKHRGRFANTLFTRLSSVKPAVKFRYLQGGFTIIGDHEQAAEAKKVFDYYKDLVSEIKLETVLDGPASVGHKQPFGVFVFLRHTLDIERESGGFGRYLQNQNTSTAFSWNYGRPTTDYRDRFQAAATEALKEHFEVVSVTFETDKVHSRAAPEYGWRRTPYAYLLLKARGPQVDKLTPLRMDLDFLDTSGYVILPIESAALPLDARAERPEPRPARKLQITQTLDERQAAQGKLLLEVKATALGLVPDLQQVLHLVPSGFDIVKTDNQGVSVSKFDEESDQVAVASERNWMVTLQAKEGVPVPQQFQFGKPKIDDTVMTYQRYNDADLVAVQPEISLEEKYGRPSTVGWLWWAAAGAIVLILATVFFFLLRRPRARKASPWKLPQPLTPFTTIGFLERIRHEALLAEGKRAELLHTLHLLERYYFAAEANGNGAPDLQDIAEGWLRQVQ
jgi:hypothetical protein